jgi:hypothetical protein
MGVHASCRSWRFRPTSCGGAKLERNMGGAGLMREMWPVEPPPQRDYGAALSWEAIVSLKALA